MLAVPVMARSVLLCWQLLSNCLINTTATEHRGALSPLSHHVVLASDSAISKTDGHRLSSRQAAGGQCISTVSTFRLSRHFLNMEASIGRRFSAGSEFFDLYVSLRISIYFLFARLTRLTSTSTADVGTTTFQS